MVKTVWTDESLAELRRLHARGLNDPEIAATLGIARGTVIQGRKLLELPFNKHRPGGVVRPPPKAYLRAENEQPWEPMPGMIKLRCDRCHFWFAARGAETMCVDCTIAVRPRVRHQEHQGVVGHQGEVVVVRRVRPSATPAR